MTIYITVAPNYWGKSKSPDDSLFNCFESGGNFSTSNDPVPFITYQCPDGAYVNEMGGINYTLPEGEEIDRENDIKKLVTRKIPKSFIDEFSDLRNDLIYGDDDKIEIEHHD